MEHKPSPRPAHRRKSPGRGFTPQQMIIIVLVTILGIATLTLASFFLFPPTSPSPAAAPVAQVGTAVQSQGNAPPHEPSSIGAPPMPPLPASCAQRNSGYELGNAAHVVDANTIEVQVDGKTVRVSYAGLVTIPEGAISELAVQAARETIEGQPVVLVRDVSDQDSSGRLVRYVFTGSSFLNFDLVRQGMAKLAPNGPDQACANYLQQAEQQARVAHLGVWLATPVPTATFMPFVTVNPAIPAGCECSAKLACSDFSTHAKAQACFNACNDYSSKLDDDRDGLACEELP